MLTETNTTATNFLQQLRANTSLSHTRLEALAISQAIVSAELTKKQYATYLSLMHDVIRDVEDFVFPVISNNITDIEQRQKVGWLESDFQAMSLVPSQKPTPFQGRFNVPFALGVMYVLEGSTLGGRVILKNVEKSLGFNPENGARYFAGYGNSTGSYWKNFLEMILRYEADSGETEAIIQGATFAFDAIYEHLCCFAYED